MKVSLNLMKSYSAENLWQLPVSELVAKIGAQIGAVEETVDWGARYDGILAVKVVSTQQHPDAERLKVVQIDDGGAFQNVPRNDDGTVQVVCGAPNVREGLTVAWIAPGATLPSTYGTEKPVVLRAIELRGVVSQGMLASPQELVVSDDHTGILEIQEDIAPGTLFKTALGLDDTIIDIENKMFTHRPDGFGHLGVAREIAGVQGLKFTSPDWYREDIELPTGEGLGLNVRNETELVSPYTAVALDNISIGPSPTWLQSYLKRVGVRPINNVVDITNYIMILTGQPLHAFDFDKISGQSNDATIVVRKARPGEKLTLLDGRQIEPYADAVVIANEDRPLALGGVMGGADSEIDDNTTRIILEAANFNLYNIRRTSMVHGVFTDAVTRFSKGQSPAQIAPTLYKTLEMLSELAGGRVASRVVSDRPSEHRNQPIRVSTEFINTRLGSSFSAEQITKILQNVEFVVESSGEELTVTAPFWRMDIEIAEDVVEEVGRLHGFSNLPIAPPKRELTPPTPDAMLAFKSKIRSILARAGANEVQTYTFVHGNLLGKVQQDPEQAYKIRNALSPDLQHYRLSLTPNLLEKIHPNIKQGFREFALFELNKVHQKGITDEAERHLPAEMPRLGLVVAAEDKTASSSYQGAAFYEAKRLLDYLANMLGLSFEYVSFAEVQPENSPLVAPFEPVRSAVVKSYGHVVGVIGEYKPGIARAFKLPAFAAGFELDTEKLQAHAAQAGTPYKVLSQFPGTEQDICFAAANNVTYAQLYAVVDQALKASENVQYTISPLDIYQRPEEPDRKQVTFRITLEHMQKTLTADEIAEVVQAVVQKASAELGAQHI